MGEYLSKSNIMNSANDGEYNHFGGISNTCHPPKTDENDVFHKNW